MPDKKIKAKPAAAPAKSAKPRPPEQTFEEVRYLKSLIDKETPVCIKLLDNEVVEGVIEYYDASFIRLTRHKQPNLFIFKHDIKYLYEAE